MDDSESSTSSPIDYFHLTKEWRCVRWTDEEPLLKTRGLLCHGDVWMKFTSQICKPRSTKLWLSVSSESGCSSRGNLRYGRDIFMRLIYIDEKKYFRALSRYGTSKEPPPFSSSREHTAWSGLYVLLPRVISNCQIAENDSTRDYLIASAPHDWRGVLPQSMKR